MEWGFGEDADGRELSPFFLLRRILRKRQILSTWSRRGGKPTVYGPSPAVCFSEMPLAAFLEASNQRSAKGENVSSYAVLLKKTQAFAAGALPVIYGVASPTARATMLPDGTRRFAASVLPEVEQFRYVAFDPTAGGKLDWSHEREWRWPNPSYTSFRPYDIPDEDAPTYAAWQQWDAERERDRSDSDGLCLDGGGFEGIGFVVKTARQAKLLLHDILSLVDSGRVSRKLFSFVLTLDQLPAATALIDRASTRDAIKAATLPLDPFFIPPANSAAIAERFLQIVRDVAADSRGDAGEHGGCWLWLSDNSHPLVRTLQLAPPTDRRVVVSRLGRYLVELPELGDERGLQLREELTQEIAGRVETEFDLSATYFSVLGSSNVDGVPFYVGAFGDEIYMNEAHNEDDF